VTASASVSGSRPHPAVGPGRGRADRRRLRPPGAARDRPGFAKSGASPGRRETTGVVLGGNPGRAAGVARKT